MTALEVMVDEICTALPLDPIEFRRRNALATGGRTMAGNPYIVSIRTPEILDKLEKHPIWKQRADEKARGQQAGILVGTGVTCATKDYGTGGDGCLASAEIAPDGRIAIYCDAVEMGTGIGTAAANRVAAYLGAVADEIALAQVDTFGPLALVTSGDSYTISRKTQDAAARNPRWVPAISTATTASIGAHVGTHAAAEAARVVFRSVCGRRRSNYGASRRTKPSPTNGRRRGGRTGNWSCRDGRHSPCRRSRQRRMRAMA
jgi:CO/xanthine dehydrogenase Mo-binding subunit